MRSIWIPTLITAAIGVGLAVTRQKVRFVGDLAQVDDEVSVPIAKLTLTGGVQLPGAAFAILRVMGQDAERVEGLVRGFAGAGGGLIPVPDALRDAIGPQRIARADLVAVVRKGVPQTLGK